MAFDILESHEMLEVVRSFAPLDTYWLDNFFPRTLQSTNEWIDFDVAGADRRLAPFVAPNVQGQPMVQRGYSTRRIKPAYLKPKDPVDPARTLLRQAGEGYGGTLTPQQREDAIVADILDTHRTMITRRWEWMGARAVIDGAITIEGENYPRVTLSFGRDAGHTVTLLTTAGWNQTTGTPWANLQTWFDLVFVNSGFAPDRITFSPEAWAAFIAHDEVKDMLETRRGSAFVVESTPSDGKPVYFAGRLPNGMEMWVYNDIYQNNNGATARYLAPGEEVITSRGMGGVRGYGAIMDRKAQYQPLPIFQKMWEQEDPSGLFILSQSAPLMFPLVPNATFKAQVLT